METFGAIALYAVLMLFGLGFVSSIFVFVGLWLKEQSAEDPGH